MSRQIKLPPPVRVGYAIYKIEWWPSELTSESGMLGECDRVGHVIKICRGMNPRETANTLLHEILHAVWKVGCCDGGDEEKIVSVFSNHFIQIWQDNPEVMDWIGKHARGGE